MPVLSPFLPGTGSIFFKTGSPFYLPGSYFLFKSTLHPGMPAQFLHSAGTRDIKAEKRIILLA